MHITLKESTFAKNPQRVTAGLESLLRRLKDSDPPPGDRELEVTEEQPNSSRICSLVHGFEFLATILAVLIPGKTAEVRHVDRLVGPIDFALVLRDYVPHHLHVQKTHATTQIHTRCFSNVRERRKAQNLCLELLIYFCAKDVSVRKLIVKKVGRSLPSEKL